MSAPVQDKLVEYVKFMVTNHGVNDSEFAKRIKNRHKIFWKAPNAEKVRNTLIDAKDSREKWTNVENWQRKLSNKFNAREFARMHNCKLAELYWKGRDCDAISFDRLPTNYVIRPTIGHCSALVFLMSNSVNLMDGRTYAKEDIKLLLKTALVQNIHLDFLIEEFLRTEEGEYKILNDYKFYIFNGEVATIQVINRFGSCKGLTTFFNKHWEVMKNINTYYPQGTYQQPPECLLEMIRKAKELSKAYEIFVRIDFYATDKGAVFGEFTPTPFLGTHFTPYANKLFIDYWDRFCKGKI